MEVENKLGMEISSRFEVMKKEKEQFNELYELISKYINQSRRGFTSDSVDGEDLNYDVFDSTASMANRRMASTLLGMLWQNIGKPVSLAPAMGILDNAETKAYYDRATRVLLGSIQDPKANMVTALNEFFNDQGSYGTSGVAVFNGEDSDLSFSCWGSDRIYIGENAGGKINTVYKEFMLTVRQIVDEYGLENVSPAVREKFNSLEKDEEVKVIHAIEPNPQRNPLRKDNKNMRYRSVHVEYETKHVLKESGFEELPVMASRFFKRSGEIYGRSPGMDALHDVLQINVMQESRTLAIEKTVDPAFIVDDDAVVGNGEIDSSPGGVIAVSRKGRADTGPAIQPIFLAGDLGVAERAIGELKTQINDHFFIDRLLDFNNETQMTLGETQIRDRIRSESLGALISRQIDNVFTPMLERSVLILLRNKKLGLDRDEDAELIAEQEAQGLVPFIIPKDIIKLFKAGKSFYEIVYFTPAVRLLKSEETAGITRTWEFALQLSQAMPDILDVLDADESLRLFAAATGGPSEILQDSDTVVKIREAKQQAAQAAAQADQQAQQTENLKGLGQAGVLGAVTGQGQ